MRIWNRFFFILFDKKSFCLFTCHFIVSFSVFLQVEKSLQRIHRGQKNAMYTTQKSIENKCGIADGWKGVCVYLIERIE